MDIQIRPRPVKPILRPLPDGRWRCSHPESLWVAIGYTGRQAYELMMEKHQNDDSIRDYLATGWGNAG